MTGCDTQTSDPTSSLCVSARVCVSVCETPSHVWLQFTCTKLLPDWVSFNRCEFWIQGRSTVSGCDSIAAILLLWVSPLSELVKSWWTTLLVCILWGEAKRALPFSPWNISAAHIRLTLTQANRTCHSHPLCVGRLKQKPPTAMFKLSSSKRVPR